MRKIAIFGFILLLGAALASAAEFTTSGLAAGQSSNSQVTLTPVDITQSSDLTVLAGYGVACSGGGLSTENHWLRRFQLAVDHSIFNQYDVLSVDLGVESTTLYSTGVPNAEARIYSIGHAAGFTFANMTLQGTGVFQLAEADDLVLKNVPVSASFADPVNTDLVLDFWIPDGQVEPNTWGIWAGANNLPQTRPSYLAAADCGVAEPIDTAAIGFPNAHWVMVVHGDEVPVELQSFDIE
jgi:hypothetical protein